jgi:hypothetical protein
MEPGLSYDSHNRPAAPVSSHCTSKYPSRLRFSRLYFASVELCQTLEEALARLQASGPVKVQENGSWLAPLEDFQYEVREKAGTTLLHLWSQEGTLVLRVISINANDDGRLALQVKRFGRTRADQLEFLCRKKEPRTGQLRREQFRTRFGEMLTQQFPDESVTSFTLARDLEHSLSGNYVRGISATTQNRSTAVMAAAPEESAATYDALLTFGLLWFDWARHRKSPHRIAALRLFFPKGTGSVVAHRLKAISPSQIVELFEYDRFTRRIRLVDAKDSGNVKSWLAPRREFEGALTQAREAIDPIRRLNAAAIRAEPIPGTSEVALRFRGLLFARCGSGGVFFGIGSEQSLTAATLPELERLVRELELQRSPLASSRQNPLYRPQAERWLESLVIADAGRIEPRIDPRFLYSQLPAISAGDRTILDLLGITRDGRLVVMELKASEDLQLVMQAIDYWLRVRHHQEQGDFQRYGYFPGIEISRKPPLLLLVAPSLQFHPAADIVARYLIPDIEICRIGLNENWRRGLRVILRQNLR